MPGKGQEGVGERWWTNHPLNTFPGTGSTASCLTQSAPLPFLFYFHRLPKKTHTNITLSVSTKLNIIWQNIVIKARIIYKLKRTSKRVPFPAIGSFQRVWLTACSPFSTRWKGELVAELRRVMPESIGKAQDWSRKDLEAVSQPWLHWHLLPRVRGLGGVPLHWRMFSNVPGLHPLDTKGTLPRVWKAEMSPNLARCPLLVEKQQLCDLPAVWPQADPFTSLSLPFLIAALLALNFGEAQTRLSLFDSKLLFFLQWLFFNILFYFIYFWLCWVFIAVWALSLAAASWGCSLVTVHQLLIAVASLVVEPGF